MPGSFSHSMKEVGYSRRKPTTYGWFREKRIGTSNFTFILRNSSLSLVAETSVYLLGNYWKNEI